MTVHIILIDVRYDFDLETNERFGQDQINWLREVMQKPSDITVIVIPI